MFRKLRPSPAMIVALIALFAALGGGAYAASLAKNSVKSKQIAPNAAKGVDIQESSLGRVPSATKAITATTAANGGVGFSKFLTSSDPAVEADLYNQQGLQLRLYCKAGGIILLKLVSATDGGYDLTRTQRGPGTQGTAGALPELDGHAFTAGNLEYIPDYNLPTHFFLIDNAALSGREEGQIIIYNAHNVFSVPFHAYVDNNGTTTVCHMSGTVTSAPKAP